jgi:RNA recognition motif-containing protein
MKKKFDFNFSTKKAPETKVSSKNFRTKKEKSPIVEEGPVSTIYIGNLNYKRDEEGVKALFAQFGYVKSVKLLMREGTELKSGVAFVQMTNKDKALMAVDRLNGKIVDQRTLKVSIANDRLNQN